LFSVPEKGGRGLDFLKIENLRKIGMRGGVGPSENRKPEENGSGERAVDKMKLVEIILYK